VAVGWVERSETQHEPCSETQQHECRLPDCALGFASLNPTYRSARANIPYLFAHRIYPKSGFPLFGLMR
jgi:hypothetical protein